MADSLIQLSNVTCSLGGQELLDNVSFGFQDTARIGLVGSNGAGKSTLLKIIARQLEPDAGEVIYRRGMCVEYVPQFVPPDMVQVPLYEALQRKLGESRQDIPEWKIDEILSRFGFLPEQYEQPLGALSGGEANRALLARAMVVKPDFLLLDEPTNHMDREPAAG